MNAFTLVRKQTAGVVCARRARFQRLLLQIDRLQTLVHAFFPLIPQQAVAIVLKASHPHRTGLGQDDFVLAPKRDRHGPILPIELAVEMLHLSAVAQKVSFEKLHEIVFDVPHLQRHPTPQILTDMIKFYF